MLCQWRLWVDCRSEHKARKLLEQCSVALGKEPTEVRVEPDDEGHLVTFAIELESRRWNDAVVEALAMGQRIADSWNLRDAIASVNERVAAAAGDRELALFTIAGIRGAAWELERQESATRATPDPDS